MGYLAVSGPKREEWNAAAEHRWRALADARPELAPAVELQRRLLAIVAELADRLAAAPMPRLSLPGRYLAAKLTRGVPVLAGEPIPLPVPVLTPVLLQLCDALARGGAGEAATHIRESLEGGKLEAASLLTASLHRDQGALRSGAV